jgi:hypothetical protein
MLEHALEYLGIEVYGDISMYLLIDKLWMLLAFVSVLVN